MALDPSLDYTDPDVIKMVVAQRAADRAKKAVTYKTPPAVEAITKAYQQDPKTRLALSAMATGASTAPVAAGKYGIADGIARALTGVAGGYIDKRQQQEYGKAEDAYTDKKDLLAAGKEQALARAQSALNTPPQADTPAPLPPQAAVQPPPAPVQPPQPPPPPPPGGGAPMNINPAVASAGAGALGAPAPTPPPPQGTPGLPVQPVPQGGRPATAAPFVQASAGSPQVAGTAALATPATSAASGTDAGAKMAAIRAGLVSQGLKVNSGFRTPDHNKAVGGVGNSYHMSGTPDAPLANDFAPRAGETMAQAEARAKAAVAAVDPSFKVLNEGNHIHVQPPSGTPHGAGVIAAPAGGADPLGPPTPQPVPELPALVEKPNAPKPVAARQSELLKAAYAMMHVGDRYMADEANKYEAAGLAEQDRMNESAAEREQDLNKMGYQSDLSAHNQSLQDRTQYGYNLAKDAVTGNREAQQKWVDWQRQASEKEKDRIAEMQRTQVTAAAKTAAGQLTPEQQAALDHAMYDTRSLNPYKVNSRNKAFLADALIHHPDMNANELNALYNIQGNVGAQTRAANLESLPDTLNNVRQSGKALNYNTIQFAGKIQKWAKGELNDPDLTAHMNQRNDAMMTVANVMRGNGATNVATQLESEAAKPTMAPKAWEAWYTGQLIAARAKIAPLEARGSVAAGTTAKIDDFINSSDYKPKWYKPPPPVKMPGGAPAAPSAGGSTDPNRSTW